MTYLCGRKSVANYTPRPFGLEHKSPFPRLGLSLEVKKIIGVNVHKNNATIIVSLHPFLKAVEFASLCNNKNTKLWKKFRKWAY
jgi:hypothetical protein